MVKQISVILLYVVLTAVSAGAIDLDSLFVKSVGGPEAVDSLRRMTSYKADGTMNMMGMEGRFVEYFVAPDRFYTEIEIGAMKLVQAYDGRTAWQIDMNGQVSEMQGFERDAVLEALYFSSHSYMFNDRFDGSYEYQGETTKDGIRYHVVAFCPLNKDTVTGYYEIKTGLLSLSIGFVDELAMHTYRRDYSLIGGILWPIEVDVIAKGAPVSMMAKYETISLNESIDQSIFRIPTDDPMAVAFPTGLDSVVVPFRYQAGHIKLPVIINGSTRVWMILDSGASANIFNKTVCDQLGLEIVGRMAAKGISAYEEVDMVRVDSIRIGNLSMHNQVSGSLDLSTISSAGPDGAPFGGVLGYDFLSRFPVLVNYQESTLTIYNPGSFNPGDNGIEVRFHLTMKVPTVRGELNGLPGDFIVDLGNAFGLVIHNRFAETHHLENQLDNIEPIPQMIGGVGGMMSGKTAFAATFKVGSVLIQSLKVLIPDFSSGLAGSEELAGNIGNLLLENFNVLFDYANSRLIFYSADMTERDIKADDS